MRTVRALGAFALTFLVAYFVGAFVAWDLNPGELDIGGRAFLAFTATVFGFGFAAAFWSDQ